MKSRGKSDRLLALLVLIAFVAPAGADAAIKRFDIAAQPAGTALNEFARQADVTLVYSYEEVAGERANAVRGELPVFEALVRLLDGTSLQYRRFGDNAIAIATRVRESAATRFRPIRLAQGESTGQSAQEVRSGAGGPSAQSAGKPSIPLHDTAPMQLEEVVVTGTHLRLIAGEGPVPVITISREDIDRSGATTVREVLNTLPQASVALDESGANSFLGASTIQLRGLSVGSTLVLINGRRVSSASETYFDLNSLPLATIERIEVLTGTASAIYGADAIGGAVNFILKKGYEGVGVSLRYGTSSRGDATEREAGLNIGGATEKYSGMLVLSAFDRDPLFAADRELTRTKDFRRFGGIDFRSTASYPANIYALPGTGNLPGLDSPIAGVPAGTDGIGLTPADFAATDGVLNRFDGAQYSTLIAETTRIGAFASGDMRLTPSVRLFGEALYSRNDQATPLGPDSLTGGANGIFVVPAENPFNPFGVPVGVDYRFVELGSAMFDGRTDYSRMLFGAEGPLLDRFDWEVSALYDRSRRVVRNRNFVNAYLPQNAAIIQRYLSSTDPDVALNVFSTSGNNNPETLRALVDGTSSQAISEGMTAEAVVRGPLMRLPAGDLQLAAGANVRRHEGDFRSQLASPLVRHETLHAFFAEAAVPLVAPAWSVPGVYELAAALAVRRDYFDAFGAETNPQFGLTWRPVRSLLIRGSYGEAFKAPTLSDQFTLGITGVSTIPDPLRGGEVSNFILSLGGNPELRPEQAESITFGAVWEPPFVPGLTLGITAFRVDHTDLIVRSLPYDTIFRHPELFGDRIVRAAPTAEDEARGWPGRILSLDGRYLNFGSVTAQGADFDLRYTFPVTRLGRFVWSALGSYIDEYEVQLIPGAPATNEVGYANRAGYPGRLKASSQLSWSSPSGLGASLTARYIPSFRDYTIFVDVDRELPAQTLWDAQASYEGQMLGLSDMRISVGAVNLTDEQGSFSNTFTGYDFQQADLRGRFFYMSVSKEF